LNERTLRRRLDAEGFHLKELTPDPEATSRGSSYRSGATLSPYQQLETQWSMLATVNWRLALGAQYQMNQDGGSIAHDTSAVSDDLTAEHSRRQLAQNQRGENEQEV
jgi:hypothetical protein